MRPDGRSSGRRSVVIEDSATVYGSYRVVDLLGQGAMGMVYRAHDPRLDRMVALKIVHPARIATNPAKARARLVAEARALARISHPNVLAVYDVGELDDVVFVALELVDGVDLALWLRARPRPWIEIAGVFAEAASGLSAVHAAGLVHRDVKPANILVERGSSQRAFGRVLVADFGIARATSAGAAITLPSDVESSSSEDDAPPLTEAGRVVGTPLYMAPEQHLGNMVGPAADQYALCVALYEALYGERPFRGAAPLLVRAKLVPPARAPASGVPRWLWRIVRRGLSPSEHDRFATMDDLASALRAGPSRRRWMVPVAATLGVTATVIAVRLASASPCDRPRAELGALWSDARRDAIAAAFVASGRESAEQTWTRVAERVDAYASELDAMYRDSCEATEARDDRSAQLFDRRMACLEHRASELAQSLELLAGGAADVVDHADDITASLGAIDSCGDSAALEAGFAPPSASQRERVAEVRRLRADAAALQAAGRYDDAARSAFAAVELARDVDYAPELVEALARFAELRERQSRIDEARQALEEAITLGVEIGYDEPVVRAAIMRTWIAAEYEHDLEAAEKWAALGRAQLKRIGDPPLWVIALHNVLGAGYTTGGRYENALREYEQALTIVADDPDLVAWHATLYSNLGNLRVRIGQIDRARESYAQAHALFRAQYGADHPNVANTAVRIAQLDELDGHHREAIAGLRRAIASLERTQATPSELATALIALGLALRNAGDDDDSNATYRRAVELLEMTGDDASLAHALVSYGHSCVDQGIFDAAEAQLERAVKLLERTDASNPELGRAWLGLGRIREQQDRPDDALSYYQRALDSAASDTRDAARALIAIALLHDAQGRYADAAVALDRHDEILVKAQLVLPDDRLNAAIARVRVMVDAGDAEIATAEIDALSSMLEDVRERGSSRLGEGDLALGRARLARGEIDAAREALTRASSELDGMRKPKLVDQARAALRACDR